MFFLVICILFASPPASEYSVPLTDTDSTLYTFFYL